MVFKGGEPRKPFEAVRVWLEPVRQLLAAVLALEGLYRAAEHGALLATHNLPWAVAELKHFEQTSRLALAPAQAGLARTVVVEALWGGKTYVVSKLRLQGDAFRFSTQFTQTDEGPTGYQHCCGGVRCGRQCVDCTGAYFFCDLVNCTIECIHY